MKIISKTQTGIALMSFQFQQFPRTQESAKYVSFREEEESNQNKNNTQASKFPGILSKTESHEIWWYKFISG